MFLLKPPLIPLPQPSHMNNLMHPSPLFIRLCILLTLGSCSWHSPLLSKFHTPDTWHESSKPLSQKATIDHRWWLQFKDPMLATLVEQARKQSPDIKIAQARIEQARAREGGSWAAQLPDISAQAGTSRARASKNLSSHSTQTSSFSNHFNSSFDASWEIDIFGIDSALRASKASRQKAEADYDQVLVTLFGDIARHYFEIRQYEAKLAVHEKTITAQKEQLVLADALYKAGQTSDADSAQANALLAATEASKAPLQQGMIEAYYQLKILLGESSPSLEDILKQPTLSAPPGIDVTLASPAAIIAERADIRSASQQLIYAAALRDTAISQYFPHLSLSGVLGVESGTSGRLFNNASKALSASAGVSMPIFDFGRIRAEVKESNALGQEALGTYEKTVLTALSEVEAAISGYHNEEQHYRDLTASVDASTRSLQVSEARYKEGLSSYLNVLDAQKTLYDAQTQQSASIFDSSIQLVRLYKALGGGWKLEEEKTSVK